MSRNKILLSREDLQSILERVRATKDLLIIYTELEDACVKKSKSKNKKVKNISLYFMYSSLKEKIINDIRSLYKGIFVDCKSEDGTEYKSLVSLLQHHRLGTLTKSQYFRKYPKKKEDGWSKAAYSQSYEVKKKNWESWVSKLTLGIPVKNADSYIKIKQEWEKVSEPIRELRNVYCHKYDLISAKDVKVKQLSAKLIKNHLDRIEKAYDSFYTVLYEFEGYNLDHHVILEKHSKKLAKLI